MNISNASDDTIQMPQWFIDPNKTDCELVIKNKREGFGGFYKKCTDKQGYMRVVFVHHATGAENGVKFLKYLHELQLRYDRHQIPIDIVNDAQKLLDDLGTI
ncbi:hypothetical protein L5515_002587 [Caenorhabditis briggsae]|uniref:Uncharacterized protein n=1 Tax=Caenorhabditis briggsae TaxID=6238 RepID=A0AAE9E940_CAEBR|nr:hypothetical protein L5515_002587 [Caenorhabditis briggsae]